MFTINNNKKLPEAFYKKAILKLCQYLLENTCV